MNTDRFGTVVRNAVANDDDGGWQKTGWGWLKKPSKNPKFKSGQKVRSRGGKIYTVDHTDTVKEANGYIHDVVYTKEPLTSGFSPFDLSLANSVTRNSEAEVSARDVKVGQTIDTDEAIGIVKEVKGGWVYYETAYGMKKVPTASRVILINSSDPFLDKTPGTGDRVYLYVVGKNRKGTVVGKTPGSPWKIRVKWDNGDVDDLNPLEVRILNSVAKNAVAKNADDDRSRWLAEINKMKQALKFWDEDFPMYASNGEWSDVPNSERLAHMVDDAFSALYTALNKASRV